MAAVGLLGMIAGVAMTPAAADSIGTKDAKANVLAAQINRLGRKETALSERYDKAVINAQRTANRLQQATRDLAVAQAKAERAPRFGAGGRGRHVHARRETR